MRFLAFGWGETENRANTELPLAVITCPGSVFMSFPALFMITFIFFLLFKKNLIEEKPAFKTKVFLSSRLSVWYSIFKIRLQGLDLSSEPVLRESPHLNMVGGFLLLWSKVVLVLFVRGDQGGLPKSVFLQAGTQPGTSWTSTQAQSRHRAACPVQQSWTLKSVKVAQNCQGWPSPCWRRTLISLHQHLSNFLSSCLLLCLEGKAPTADFRTAPKLRICPNNRGVFSSDKSLHSSRFLDESPHTLLPALHE